MVTRVDTNVSIGFGAIEFWKGFIMGRVLRLGEAARLKLRYDIFETMGGDVE